MKEMCVTRCPGRAIRTSSVLYACVCVTPCICINTHCICYYIILYIIQRASVRLLRRNYQIPFFLCIAVLWKYHRINGGEYFLTVT
jgi:hypothetical protein